MPVNYEVRRIYQIKSHTKSRYEEGEKISEITSAVGEVVHTFSVPSFECTMRDWISMKNLISIIETEYAPDNVNSNGTSERKRSIYITFLFLVLKYDYY